MYPIAIRWQVVDNRRRVQLWASIMDHVGCSLAAANTWWANYKRHGSPWNDDVIQNRHADAAVFNPEFFAALDTLVRSHPETVFWEMEAIFRKLADLPGWEQSWPVSTTTLSRKLKKIGFSVKQVERLALKRSHALRVAFSRLYFQVPDRCIVVLDETHVAGLAMVRRRGWARIGRPLEALAPDPRARARFSSTVAISCTRGIFWSALLTRYPLH